MISFHKVLKKIKVYGWYIVFMVKLQEIALLI